MDSLVRQVQALTERRQAVVTAAVTINNDNAALHNQVFPDHFLKALLNRLDRNEFGDHDLWANTSRTSSATA